MLLYLLLPVGRVNKHEFNKTFSQIYSAMKIHDRAESFLKFYGAMRDALSVEKAITAEDNWISTNSRQSRRSRVKFSFEGTCHIFISECGVVWYLMENIQP